MSFKTLLLVLAVPAAVFLAGCDDEPTPLEGFNPQQIQSTERKQGVTDMPQMLPLPTTREEPAPSENSESAEPSQQAAAATPQPSDFDKDPIIRLTLHEIIDRAVLNNHDVKVAGYQPAIEGNRVEEANGNFDPVFYTNAQYSQKHELNGGTFFDDFLTGGLIFANATNENTGDVQIGVQQNLDSGGQVQLQWQTQYSWFNPQQTLLNPFYEGDLTLSITQPLLRNFGYDVNHAQITINRLNQKVSLLEFRKAVEQDASDIEKAYWQLQQAAKDVAIERDLLAQAQQTYNVLYNRMQQGLDVSDLQVSQAQTEIETRKAQLIQYQSHARDLSDQIKALMSDPEFPTASNVLILPADDPVVQPIQYDVQDQIDTALSNRFEIGEQQLKVDAAAVTVGVAENNLLPQFDFIGSVGPQGAAGNIGDTTLDMSEFTHVDFTVGFKMQIPLGNRAARAIYRRALLTRLQAIEQYRSEIEQVCLDVKTAVRGVVTAWEEIRANRAARFQAEAALRLMIDRETSQTEHLTPEFVQTKLQLLEQVAQTLHAENQAVANYNIALSQLERAKGTLLLYNNVILQEDKP